MAETKHRFTSPQQRDSAPVSERRRMGRIVHNHKGTATVEWHDAPADYKRPPLALEEDTRGRGAGQLDTGSLAIESRDSHNPYMRIPEAERKRPPGGRTDLRKLSAWIKMMRELEEAKKRNDDE
jgi:hypothetical protein